jgi:hypothetical protein
MSCEATLADAVLFEPLQKTGVATCAAVAEDFPSQDGLMNRETLFNQPERGFFCGDGVSSIAAFSSEVDSSRCGASLAVTVAAAG